MSARPCRDCGCLLEPNVRGCPRCALNLEAEIMIERFVWGRLVPGILVVAVVGTGILCYVLR
jgi:hypothetical protein